MDKRYQVFVSSTFADLKEERAKVIQTIMELDCIPAGMEIFPAIDEEQFEFIKRVIDDCDYYLLIIGGRYGSLSEDGISYTEKEYDYAIEKNIKVIAFIHSNPDEIPVGKTDKNSGLRKKLEAFKAKVSTKRLVKSWSKVDELPGLVALNLSKTIKTYPAIGWIRANTPANPDLYKQLSELQRENQELKELRPRQDNGEKETLENLADLEDSITISGKYIDYDEFEHTSTASKWNTTITWKEIFSLISPYLIEHPIDSKVKSLLSKALYSFVPDPLTGGSPNIDEQDYQTIKIHLKALGLIDMKNSITEEGKGKRTLSWSLTEFGEILMLKLRSVKKVTTSNEN